MIYLGQSLFPYSQRPNIRLNLPLQLRLLHQPSPTRIPPIRIPLNMLRKLLLRNLRILQFHAFKLPRSHITLLQCSTSLSTTVAFPTLSAHFTKITPTQYTAPSLNTSSLRFPSHKRLAYFSDIGPSLILLQQATRSA
jgi:hypothetical protein